MSQENNIEVTQDANQNSESLRATSQLIAHSRAELGRVISGQNEVIEEVLIAVLCQGHALLEGVPGIAKTLIVKALGRLLGLGFQRVQATPDLMPADILGTTILRPGSADFAFHAGPVFTDLLLVDEINRMPPRTQAALLECMEERQVTSDGVRRALPKTLWILKARTPCPKRNWTDSYSRFAWLIPQKLRSGKFWSGIMRARARDCWRMRRLRLCRMGCWPRHAPRCGQFGLSRSFTTTFSRLCGARGSGPRCCWAQAPAPP